MILVCLLGIQCMFLCFYLCLNLISIETLVFSSWLQKHYQKEGLVMATSSHPCMLRFRSLPIRLMREFIMSVPLVLGLTAETQTIVVPMLKHKEGLPRTEAIRITMIPRAGTFGLPQLYQSQIILKSQPPWYKNLVTSGNGHFCLDFNVHVCHSASCSPQLVQTARVSSDCDKLHD
uniref:Putative ovule protein n=1 Tax=Solanum chacoense TaxID=4108 RepID=A0A0V0HSZ0_SOLCH